MAVPADPIVAFQAGTGRCAGDALRPVLYGEGGPPVWRYMDGQGPPGAAVWWPHFASRVIEAETSSYEMSPVAIRIRHSAAAVGRRTYTVTNRLLGEANASAAEGSRAGAAASGFVAGSSSLSDA